MFLVTLWPTVLNACASASGDTNANESGSNTSALSDVVTSPAAVTDEPFTTPLPIPPLLTPDSSDASTDYYSLTIKEGLAQLLPGAATPIVGFDGIAPGPTIVATRGRAV